MNLNSCSRRHFIQATGLSVSGLILGFRLFPPAANAELPVDSRGIFQPNAYIAIDAVTGVTLAIACPEIGQNIRTSFAMVLADELGADLQNLTLLQTPPMSNIGNQGAGGSSSVRSQFMPMRQAAAAAREMLLGTAAAQWNVSPAECSTDKSMVHGPGGKTIRFQEIAIEAAKQPIPTAPKLKSPADFQYIGKPTRCLDSGAIVTGSITFGIDAQPKNTAFAVMLRCPVHQGTLKNFDASEALAMPGVKKIVRIDDKIAVIATNTWTAINASRVVKVDWDPGKNGSVNSEELEEKRKEAVRNGKPVSQQGDFEAAFSESTTQLDEGFFVPLIAHIPLEPPNCAAWFHPGGVEIWGSTQTVGRLYEELPQMTGLPHDKIKYHQLRIGGGFGRKLARDYVEEGIQIAKEVDYPVKMIFTREDDLRHDLFRLPDRYRYRVAMGKNGYPQAIEETSTRKLNAKQAKRPSGIMGFFQVHTRKEGAVPAGIQGGALRAPGHNITCFVEQCLIDIMAEKAGIDTMDYQLALHGEESAIQKLGWPQAPHQDPAFCELLRIVRERSKWKSDPNFGYGVATFSGYGSHCALVALVPKNGGTRPVEKFFAVVRCGQVINPLGAQAQIEGGIIDNLSATLYQKITVKEGGVQQSNFHDYKVLRMAEHPDIDIFIAESDGAPQGLGEVSYPPTAAATTNAIFAATGRRHSTLPVRG